MMETKITREMMNQAGDHLVIATGLSGFVRAVAVRSTETVRELVRVHDLFPDRHDRGGEIGGGHTVACI